MSRLELLAPARNKAFGMAAVDHGADAVYIGAEKFGARAAVGNSIRDIQSLCDYAHLYRTKVYVALNTLLFDHELAPAQNLVRQLWDAGADALIIQDMGLLELDLPPIPLFASTQTDNRSPEKVKFLEQAGFQRVILARELGLDAVSKIRAATRVDLEAFVHGALCVCWSGQCYMSAFIGGRSANRGVCGQPCRLAWDLKNQKGRVLAKNRYLLSLKDMDRSDFLADLAAAGITSFKIEGRLKDLAYVKNITAFYRQKLDDLIQGQTGYESGSSGRVTFSFTPNPAKTFNRGVTDYYLGTDGPASPAPVHSPDTPKSKGEPVGRVKHIDPDGFFLSGRVDIRNGDGLCFTDKKGKFQGFRINRVGRDGKLFPPGRAPMKSIPLAKGTPMFRNHDQAFEKAMAGDTAQRRLALGLSFQETRDGIALSGIDEDNIRAEVHLNLAKEPARNPAQARAAIEKQLGKLGRTPFYPDGLAISSSALFIPAKVLNQLRRDLAAALIQNRITQYKRAERPHLPPPSPCPFTLKDFRLNVANRAARAFYEKRGVSRIAPAFERSLPDRPVPVMTTRHCVRYSLGHCTRDAGSQSGEWKGPLYLENHKARFRVRFDCKNCGMQILSSE